MPQEDYLAAPISCNPCRSPDIICLRPGVGSCGDCRLEHNACVVSDRVVWHENIFTWTMKRDGMRVPPGDPPRIVNAKPTPNHLTHVRTLRGQRGSISIIGSKEGGISSIEKEPEGDSATKVVGKVFNEVGVVRANESMETGSPSASSRCRATTRIVTRGMEATPVKYYAIPIRYDRMWKAAMTIHELGWEESDGAGHHTFGDTLVWSK